MLIPCGPVFAESRRVILPGGLLRPEMCPGLGQLGANSGSSWDPVILVALILGSLFLLGGRSK